MPPTDKKPVVIKRQPSTRLAEKAQKAQEELERQAAERPQHKWSSARLAEKAAKAKMDLKKPSPPKPQSQPKPKWYERWLAKLNTTVDFDPSQTQAYTLYIGFPISRVAGVVDVESISEPKHVLILHGRKNKSCQAQAHAQATQKVPGSPLEYEFHKTDPHRCKVLEVVMVGVIKAEHYRQFAAILARVNEGDMSCHQIHWALETARDEGLLDGQDVARALYHASLSERPTCNRESET
ncbi:hypothetical protein BDW74DRAFT_181170 [Aspergillus multicolor]|uniref:uncharacterized protein n=1 Tax=Aspergillus multicolor TaxID=41759 RepID=UPI003CCD2CA2